MQRAGQVVGAFLFGGMVTAQSGAPQPERCSWKPDVISFVRSWNNAIMQHRTLLENLSDHAKQADDERYRNLCLRYVPTLENHQRMLEEYGQSVGAEGHKGLKGALGAALGKARDTVDAMRETDFLRLVGDIVTMRQSQDTFATFAIAGDRLGDTRLAELGRMGEREHDTMQREFNTLVADMFVDHVTGNVKSKEDTGAASTVTT